jgi:hypothetical protein
LVIGGWWLVAGGWATLIAAELCKQIPVGPIQQSLIDKDPKMLSF